MAASLKMTAIAEIIESEAAATALQEMGCEYGQGYYFSAPIEAEEALDRLRRQDQFQPRPASPEDSSPTQILASLDVSSPTVTIPPLDYPAVTDDSVTADASPTAILPPLPSEYPPPKAAGQGPAPQDRRRKDDRIPLGSALTAGYRRGEDEDS
jgi:hypothetical protein